MLIPNINLESPISVPPNGFIEATVSLFSAEVSLSLVIFNFFNFLFFFYFHTLWPTACDLAAWDRASSLLALIEASRR